MAQVPSPPEEYKTCTNSEPCTYSTRDKGI